MNSLHILFRHFLITICPEVDYSLQEFEFPLDVVEFRAQFYFFSFCHGQTRRTSDMKTKLIVAKC